MTILSTMLFYFIRKHINILPLPPAPQVCYKLELDSYFLRCIPSCSHILQEASSKQVLHLYWKTRCSSQPVRRLLLLEGQAFLNLSNENLLTQKIIH